MYEALSQKEDEISRIVAAMFTKSASHAAQREYRFVIFCDRDAAERVLLRISGMMRDALAPTTHGLVRVAPAESATEVKAAEPTRSRQSSEVRYIRATSTERVAERNRARTGDERFGRARPRVGERATGGSPGEDGDVRPRARGRVTGTDGRSRAEGHAAGHAGKGGAG